MRSYRRPKVVPPTLRANGAGGRAGQKNIERYQEYCKSHPNRTLYKPMPDCIKTGHWRKSDVRGALIAMQGYVCAYCGFEIEDREVGQVDHFRPKKAFRGNSCQSHHGYWWLAYEFSNYYLSCEVCNEKRKMARFPLECADQRVIYEQRHHIGEGREPRLLLSPALDPLDDWFELKMDEASTQLKLTFRDQLPSGSDPAQVKARVEKTVEIFRLNKDPEHFDQRAKALDKLEGAENSQDYQELSAKACRFEPNSYIYYRLLQKTAQQHLPDEQTSLLRLLDTLTKKLRFYCTRLEKKINQSDSIYEKRIEEIRWAFAFLCCQYDDVVEEHLQKEGWSDLIAENQKGLS